MLAASLVYPTVPDQTLDHDIPVFIGGITLHAPPPDQIGLTAARVCLGTFPDK